MSEVTKSKRAALASDPERISEVVSRADLHGRDTVQAHFGKMFEAPIRGNEVADALDRVGADPIVRVG